MTEMDIATTTYVAYFATLFFILGWIALSVVVAAIGAQRGRGPASFWISFLFSPLIGLLAVIAMTPKQDEPKETEA